MTAPSPAQISLWSQSAASKHSAEIRLLLPLALELARKAGTAGVTIADVRVVAVQRGLIGEPPGRGLSYLGAVMRAAGLRATGGTRRSVIGKSHGNRHTIWVLSNESVWLELK